MKILTKWFAIVAHYGSEHQKRKAVEEMAELTTALAREQDNRASAQDVITEIADVYIMLRQLMEIYGKENCKQEIARKLKRLGRKMERENES